MTKLKPQLIVSGPGKKKGGFASGIGYFFVLIIVFVLGIYVGMRVDKADFGEEQLISMEENNALPNQNSPNEPKEAVVEVSKEKTSADHSTSPEQASLADEGETIYQAEDLNSEVASLDESEELGDQQEINNGINTDSGESVTNLNIESAVLQPELAAESLIDEDTYRLQVAAFGNIDHANEVTNELRLKGYDAYIVTTSNSRGEVWNLIKVGKFNTAQGAWNFSTIFQSKEGGEVFVESLNKGRVYNESLEEKNDTL